MASTQPPAQGYVPPPSAGVQLQDKPPVQREDTPWERRGELGLIQGFWQTWKKTMLSPETFWPSVRPDRPWTDALFYGWAITAVNAVLAVPFMLLNFSSMQEQFEQVFRQMKDLPPELMQTMRDLSSHSGAFALGIMVSSIVFYPLGFIINSGIIHLFCLIWGAGKNGFNATARVIGYSSAPLLLGWIPVVGGLVGIYALVLECWGISKVQETTMGRAVGGVLSIVGLVFCCICGIGVFAVMAAVGQSR
jgi:hypothetical protein